MDCSCQTLQIPVLLVQQTNKQRNAITAAIFKNHILATHPDVDSDKLSLGHTLMVEAHMTKNKTP
jgi:hypothetical protein